MNRENINYSFLNNVFIFVFDVIKWMCLNNFKFIILINDDKRKIVKLKI